MKNLLKSKLVFSLYEVNLIYFIQGKNLENANIHYRFFLIAFSFSCKPYKFVPFCF